LLREERFCAVVPCDHPFAAKPWLAWRQLADQPLIVLARREGVGLHDAVLTACREANFSPRLAYTPSIIGTVLAYVEAGAGIGIVPDSVIPAPDAGRLVPLRPQHIVPLVLAWQEKDATPPVERFRELVGQMRKSGALWQA
jgi:DNA-binding transcriptional LysR family regulator